MHDAIGVHAANCWDDIVHNVTDLFLAEVVFIDDDLEKLLAFAVFCYDVLELALFEDFVDF